MKFGYTIIYVPNVQETSAFYQKAFGLKTAFVAESGHYIQMATGQTALSFVSESFVKNKDHMEFTENALNKKPGGFQISLVTDDVPKAYEHAQKAGAKALVDPKEMPWGQTICYVRDLNGVLVEICSEITMPDA